jgi:ABC-type amino acid transport substrate-binding protein
MKFLELMLHFVFFALISCMMTVSIAAFAQEAGGYCGQPIRVGVRDDAPPFSFRPSALLAAPESDKTAENCGVATSSFPDHAGFSIALCNDFLTRMNQECVTQGRDAAIIEVVSLTASERVDALLGTGAKEVDLLCGATTATVWMSGRLPHTLYTFVTPTRAMIPARFGGDENAQCRIGVIGGTTSSRKRAEETMLPGWDRFVGSNQFCGNPGEPPVVTYSYADYPEAISDLLISADAAKSDLLIGDHHILRWYQENLSALDLRTPDDLTPPRIGQRSFTLEPYAIFGGHDDQELIAKLNLHLAEQQRDGTFDANIAKCFGRRIDESLSRLLEIQRRIPLGDPEAE